MYQFWKNVLCKDVYRAKVETREIKEWNISQWEIVKGKSRQVLRVIYVKEGGRWKTLVWFSCREYIVNSTNLSYNLDDLQSENYNFIFNTCIIKTWSSHGGWQKELCRTSGLSQMLSWACCCSSIVRQSSVALEAQAYITMKDQWAFFLVVWIP